MKKIKHLLFLAICLGLFLQINAAPVDRAVAKKAAITYCKYKTSFFKQSLNASSVVNEHTLFYSGKATLYVFNFEDGYVITTADDRAPAIIAYSPKGNFDVNNINPAVKYWIEPIQEHVALLQIQNPKANKHEQWVELQSGNVAQNVSYNNAKGVAPLLTSTWGQGSGYNDACPLFDTLANERCVTGCVATAMAQIMYYHKYPATGNGSNSYTHIYYGTLAESFNNVPYNWAVMTDVANASSQAEISKLIYHAGISVNMNYGPDGSGTQSEYATSALQNNFRYRPDVRSINRIDYTILNWQRVLKENIDAHQPVLYSGQDDSISAGGHAWVCDGYNDNNYFHMNWGWDGSGNSAYYWVDSLKVSIGGQLQGRFNAGQSAVVNIAPLDHKFCYETRVYKEPNFTLTDGSGLSPYKNNSDCRVLIDLDTMAINLTFTYFNTETNNDVLKIYKGIAAIEDSLIGTYSGISTPAPISRPQGEKLYLVFTSNDAVQGEGWTATVAGTWQGVEETATVSNNVRLYPNPATDNLLVTVPELSNSNTTVSFMDITGRTAYSSQVQFSPAGNAFINTSSLTAGVYIIKIASANATFSTKLIKK